MQTPSPISSGPTLMIDWQIVLVAFEKDVKKLDATIERLLSHSLTKDILILASDKPALRERCARWDIPAQYSLPNHYPESGYWQSLLQSLNYRGKRTLFIRAGALVPTAWDGRLIATLEESSALAVSPVSAQHNLLTLFSAPRKPLLSVDALDQWLVEYARGESFDIPLLLESAAALQGESWVQLLANSKNDAELFLSAHELGLPLLATDQLYVDDSAVQMSHLPDKLPLAWKEALSESHPLMSIRHAMTELDSKQEAPPSLCNCLPVRLHVVHSWGGGMGRWIEDAVEGDSKHQNLVLRPLGDWGAFGKRLALYRNAQMDRPIKSWLLSQPILSTTASHYQYRQILAEIVREFKVESLMVSSLIGQSLDLLRTALPTTIVCHDFYPFCPPLVATYGEPCTNCDPKRLEACLASNPNHRFFIQETTEHWKNIRSEFVELVLQANIRLVAPSKSVVKRYHSLVPTWKSKEIEIIEHGLNLALSNNLAKLRSKSPTLPNARLRIVVLGSLVTEKGGDLLAELIPKLGQFADIWLIGSGESGRRFSGISSVTVIEFYEREELALQLTNVQAEIGLLLSIVPETFSYTLSELWAAGIPVVATDVGAFSDRLKDGKNGWLVTPEVTAILRRLVLINESRTILKNSRAFIGEQATRSSQMMMDDYHELELPKDCIPRKRFFLARRQYNNPYKSVVITTQQPAGDSNIDYQLPFLKVLSEFLYYAGHKLNYSPRLPKWPRRK
ncbi:MAG: hypothetical protein DRQ61_11360, partial [Gammaproteobacteria bacterium]